MQQISNRIAIFSTIKTPEHRLLTSAFKSCIVLIQRGRKQFDDTFGFTSTRLFFLLDGWHFSEIENVEDFLNMEERKGVRDGKF